jgi:hypothetical protein
VLGDYKEEWNWYDIRGYLAFFAIAGGLYAAAVLLHLQGVPEQASGIVKMLYTTEIVTISIIATGLGFFACAARYLNVDDGFTYESPSHGKPSPIFTTLFGFLAGLAITNGLMNYYGEYISIIEYNIGSFEDILRDRVFKPDVRFEDYIIPNLHLIEFFVVAIPLVHSVYVFLSSIVIKNIQYKSNNKVQTLKKYMFENPPLALVTIFAASIIQVAFLFFLGGSIANLEITTQLVPSIPPDLRPDPLSDLPPDPPDLYSQSNAFLFWLTLVVIVATAGSVVYRINISQKSRIRWEWVILYVITIGFLITISLTVFRLGLISDTYQLFLFHAILLSILVSRAVLDYVIGRRIYFPDSYPKPGRYLQTTIENMHKENTILETTKKDLLSPLDSAKKILVLINQTSNTKTHKKIQDLIGFIRKMIRTDSSIVSQADELIRQAEEIKKEGLEADFNVYNKINQFVTFVNELKANKGLKADQAYQVRDRAKVIEKALEGDFNAYEKIDDFIRVVKDQIEKKQLTLDQADELIRQAEEIKKALEDAGWRIS